MSRRRRKSSKPRGFDSWVDQVIAEDKKLRFEKRPSARFGRDNTSKTIEKKGRITRAEIVLNSKLKKHPKLLKVVAKHEIRENLAFQNFASKREAHVYALKGEKRDLKHAGLSRKEYTKKIRKIGYIP